MKSQIQERTEMTLRSSSGIWQEEDRTVTAGSYHQDDSAPRVHIPFKIEKHHQLAELGQGTLIKGPTTTPGWGGVIL